MSGRFLYVFGDFRLDPVDKVLYRNGQPVPLTPKALDTLVVLVERHPRLVPKDDLLARVWPGTFVEDNNLAQHVSLLRRVLATGHDAPVIETVPRRGYRFCPPVTRCHEEDDRPAEAPVLAVPHAAGAGGAPPTATAMLETPAPARHQTIGWLPGAGALLVLGAAVIGLVLLLGRPLANVPEASASQDAEARLAYLGGRAAFAQGYADTGNSARARADLERAVARDPGFAPAWAVLARVYGAQYRTGADRDPSILDAAERAARTAVSLDPRLPEGQQALAEIFFNRREDARARQVLEANQSLLGGDAAYWHLLGFIAQREGRWRASETAFSKAFDLDGPATAEWLAVNFLHLRNYEEANRVLAVALASSRTAAVVPQAWARFSEHGDIAAARQGLETALVSRTTPDARVIGLLTQLEWFDGRGDRALELVGTMEDAGAWLAPNFRFPAATVAGDVLSSLGRHAEARARYTDALTVLERRRLATPDDPRVMASLGLTLAGLGRDAEAVRDAERAVALLPREKDAGEGPLYLYLLARVHARLGHRSEAFGVLDTMFEAPGFYSEAWVQRDPSFSALRDDPAYHSRLEHWATRKGDVLLDRPVARDTRE